MPVVLLLAAVGGLAYQVSFLLPVTPVLEDPIPGYVAAIVVLGTITECLHNPCPSPALAVGHGLWLNTPHIVFLASPWILLKSESWNWSLLYLVGLSSALHWLVWPGRGELMVGYWTWAGGLLALSAAYVVKMTTRSAARPW